MLENKDSDSPFNGLSHGTLTITVGQTSQPELASHNTLLFYQHSQIASLA